MKKILIYVLVILIVNVSFLFSPEQKQKGPNAFCPHQYIHINSFMRFPVNCDSYTFIGASIRPSYLWQKNFIRQSRPLYIVAGSVSGYFIYYLSYPFHSFIQPHLKNKFSGEYSDSEMNKALIYTCFYAGYILLNTITLILSFVLFEKIVSLLTQGKKKDQFVFLICLFLLVSSQVSKDYFWAAHQQMFNVFSPLLCIYAGIKILHTTPGFRKLAAITFGSGLLVLVYGNFLVLLPTILCCYLYTTKGRQTVSTRFFRSTVLGLLFFLPALCWVFGLKLAGINFYSYETDVFRQFVWVSDAIFQKKILTESGKNLLAFLKTFGSLSAGICLLIIAGFNGGFQRSNSAGTTKKTAPISYIGLVSFVLVEFIIFLFLLGYYADRLTFSLLPILLCFFAAFTNSVKLNTSMKILVAAVILFWHLYIFFFNAPHFSEYYFYR